MKYKLLKEYPELEIGAIGEFQIGYLKYKFDGKCRCVYIDSHIVEMNPDWFEPVIERWRAKYKEGYYFIQGDGYIRREYELEIPEAIICADRQFNCGNYFRTSEQVEEASRRIKKVLMDYHKEIGE